MKTAFATGDPADFENIIMGGARTLNGPQGALAFDMEGCDSVQFGNVPCAANQESVAVVPPPPAVASAAYGTELVELYWGSLLRDVAFTDYATNPTAIQAAAETFVDAALCRPEKWQRPGDDRSSVSRRFSG